MNAFALLLRALVVRHARAARLRAAVTLMAVALGVAAAYAIDLANATAIASFARSVNVIANRVNLQIVGAGAGFDERALLRMQQVPGVENASPIVEGDAIVGSPDLGANGEIVRVIGIDSTRASAVPGARDARLANAAFDLARFIDDRGIIVSARVATQYGLVIGRALRMYAGARAVAVRVMGIIPPKSSGVDSSVAFVDIATAQEMFHSVGRLDRIDLEVEPHRLTPVAYMVERVVPPGARVLEPKTRLSEIQGMLASFQMNLTALSFIALLVGMYLIYNAVAISVVQRTSEIGTLRALGTTRGAIFRTFVAEGALYGMAGSLLGLLLGLTLARFAVHAVENTVSTLYITTHADTVVVTLGATIKAFLLGTALAMASAIIPAIDAAATLPARAMRANAEAERLVPGFSRATAAAGLTLILIGWLCMQARAIHGIPVFGYVAGVLLIAGASLCTPLILRAAEWIVRALPLRRASVTIADAFLRASPRRLSVAIASLAVAVAMTVAIAVLVGSFRATIEAWTRDTLRADLYVGSTSGTNARGPITPQQVARIRRLPGVRAADTLRAFSVPIAGRFADLGAIDFDTLLQRRTLRFIGSIDRSALADADGAVVSEPFSTQFGLRTGDTFDVTTPSGVHHVRIAGVYNDYSTGGGTFFVDRRTLQRYYHDDSVDSVAVYVTSGAHLATVRSEIVRVLAPLRINISTNGELRAYGLGVFDRTFAITSALYGVSMTIAILGVVSTLFALVLERRFDIALLRCVGLSRGGVRMTVLVQALVVGVLAGGLGVVLGIALATDLIAVINRQSFGWLIEWRSPGWFYLEAWATVIVAALVSAIYPARVASSLRTSEVLRAE